MPLVLSLSGEKESPVPLACRQRCVGGVPFQMCEGEEVRKMKIWENEQNGCQQAAHAGCKSPACYRLHRPASSSDYKREETEVMPVLIYVPTSSLPSNSSLRMPGPEKMKYGMRGRRQGEGVPRSILPASS